MNRLLTISLQAWRMVVTAWQAAAVNLLPPFPAEPAGKKRVTMVQFGDYAEGYSRLANGGAENYYAQRYTVDFVSSLSARKDIESVAVICFSSDTPLQVLPNGVHTLGVRLYPPGQPARYRDLVRAVAATRPTHLFILFPCAQLIHWGIRARIQVLPMFADSFRARSLRARVEYRILSWLLNSRAIAYVSNHNLAASLDLKAIGVDAGKIVPFDWPALISPQDYAAKSGMSPGALVRMVYVGSVMQTKGVGDAIRAVAKLRLRGRAAELTVIGRGDLDSFRSLAQAEGVGESVHFLGPRSHAEVLEVMRSHDLVVVPSHWAYPEGLPMTLYEALCTRTPLIVSDHPMFALRIRDGYNALVFPQQDATALAACVERLADSPELYARLSMAAADAASDYLCPLKYDALISSFLDPVERRKLANYALPH